MCGIQWETAPLEELADTISLKKEPSILEIGKEIMQEASANYNQCTLNNQIVVQRFKRVWLPLKLESQ